MDRSELLRRYLEGEKNFSKLNLSKLCLRNLDLKGINFSKTNLSYIDFSGSNLSDANLSQANLSHSDLCATNLENANCEGADLRNAGLVADCHGININFSYADFRGDSLDEGIVEKSKFIDANFIDCHISQYSFIECNLTGANFSQTRLSEVSFDNCNLTNANFAGAFLDLNFRNSILDNVNFRQATLDIANKNRLNEITHWKNIDYTRTVFYFSYYSGLSIPESIDVSKIIEIRCKDDLTGLDLSGCNLVNIEFSGMNLTNVNLRNAKLSEQPEFIDAIFCNTILPDGTVWSNV